MAAVDSRAENGIHSCDVKTHVSKIDSTKTIVKDTCKKTKM